MDGLEHAGASRMNVAAGSHAEASLESGGKVGNDVAEHIVGDDDVELTRIADHLHAERVDVHVLRGDLRIFGADGFKNALPKTSGVSHGVRLVAEQDFVAGRPVNFGVALAILEGVADDALDTFARVDVFLCGNFVGSSLLEDASGIRVNTFRIFAEDHEVDIPWLNAFQRAEGSVEQPDGADIGVEIHFKAHAEEDFFCMDVRLYPGIAEGSHQDGVKVA